MLYKCACSWPSRVFKNWKYSLSTAHHFSPFLIRQTVMAQTPHWDISSLKSFPTSHIPPHWIWEKRECSSSLLTRERLLAPQGRGREDVLTGYSFAWSGINQKEAIKKSKNKEGKKRATEKQSQIVLRWNNNGTTQLKQIPVIFPGESR